MAKSIIDKYSNYNVYIVGCSDNIDVYQLQQERLLKAIESCVKMLKYPWLRFMKVAEVKEPHCIVFEGDIRVTKLIPFSDVEKMIEEGKFHK